MRALSSQIREPSSQHALSMTHNDLKCTKNRSLLLRLFACISLRNPWVLAFQGLLHVHLLPVFDEFGFALLAIYGDFDMPDGRIRFRLRAQPVRVTFCQ